MAEEVQKISEAIVDQEKEKSVPKFVFHSIPESKTAPFTDNIILSEGLARSEPGGFVLTPEFGRNYDEFLDFQIRKDDAWVVTFPKCGTTWTQEMVWMLINDCDAELAKQTPLTVRAPFLEVSRVESMESSPPEMFEFMPPVSSIDQMTSPRVIKSHLPFFLLPPKLLDTCKVVYVARNPKDVIVSFYHHHKLMKMQGCDGNLENFADYFMKDQVIFCPYFPHILDAWTKRSHPNMLFIFYEDMKKDLRGEVEKVAKFLGKPLTEEKMIKLLEHLKFDNISKNESVNFEIGKKIGFMSQDGAFIRKGKTGDWKNHFSPELNRRIDAWVEANLAETDLRFEMELEKQD
ncbi:hypothetical protein DAPPUDRAFT_231919 [Daphnia pulex]|uniref:Sulfotransferase domain-containing protein n=1 Tax=Daphnia pulex TaxID=6669 RepID=E9HX43_DAPPU|nr:hypothetical protein DAPPUDRAFT_231919 [Daphnia pulex]|eukprot:EFX63687.1 hypothetical protein DAPPUDRAFT_231919 [Daphnia pulex]